MTKGNQSPVNLAYRLDCLKQSLAKLETPSRPEAEHEARRLVSLLRASSEFRGMDPLLKLARAAEQATSGDLPHELRALIDEIQQEIDRGPRHTGAILIVSSDDHYTAQLEKQLGAQRHITLRADSSHMAKELLANNGIAFCIVDIVLADLDGRAFITDLRTHPETAALPVIAITPGASAANDQQPIPVFGADSVFSKTSSLADVSNYLMLRLKRNHIKGVQARRDRVTGLPNRAACHEIYQQLQRSVHTDDPIAFILVGIHQFSTVSQDASPFTCDELIRKIGSILSDALRVNDVVARWDTAEFAIILTGEDHFGATKAMEKILPDLAELFIKSLSGKLIPITTCIGLTVNKSNISIEDAALRAESHLYMAYSDADSTGGKQIVSDALPISHREEPVAICLTHAGMAKVIKQILERETFRVEVFPDSESVFKRLTQSPFSLLILDDELPQDSGFQLLQRLNEHPARSNLGTLMMISRNESIERVMKLGATDYFNKPPTMPAFLSQIRRVINHNSQLQSNPGITIMVADHELPQLLLAGTTLHQLGSCQVLLAKNAADALQRLHNTHPEYLILDTLLPHISVIEFIKQVRNMEWLKNTKIILASADLPTPSPHFDGQPVVGAVTRPFSPASLLKELHTLIPNLPRGSVPGRTPTDPRLLELEIQRILALKS